MKTNLLFFVVAALATVACAEDQTDVTPRLGDGTRQVSGVVHLTLVTNLPMIVSCGTVSARVITNFPAPNLANPLIDYPGFLEGARQVGELRKTHRVSEDEFRLMAEDPATVVFDARSDAKFAQLHVKGAKHLSFPDITADELAKIIPAKSTRVLIYCNNNFLNEPRSFPSKAAPAALNINTFTTLFSYGYTNVYELGPLIDIAKSKIEFERAPPVQQARVLTK